MASRSVRPPPPCPHLQDYRSSTRINGAGGIKPFRSLQQCLRVRPPGGRAEIRRDPNEVPRCGSCGTTGPRLYACLACAAVSCRSHAPDHAESARPGGLCHHIAVDVDRAELFCCACRDQVYDVDFDAAVVLTQKKASSSPSSSSTSPPPLPPVESLRKRKRVEYRPWSPDVREQEVMRRGASLLPSTDVGAPSISATVSSSSMPWGLRGLNNLGSTCFMNSVLQALLHTPPLRNYFLSDRHNQYMCRQRRSARLANASGNASASANHHYPGRNNRTGGRKGKESDLELSKMVCLVCDFDAMYSAVFSGDRTPYSPAKFLYSWWQHASNLATYEQQDAHEFFISLLDGIHEKLGKDQRKPHIQGSGDCCISHRIFSGILRSDVTCTVCGFTSTTYDPCIDISLNLDSAQTPVKMTASKSDSCNGETVPTSSSTSTLVGCLEHFTRPERLGPDQKLFCQHCQVRQESLKQMSIRKLPLVTSFHIKRFEHSTSRKTSRKVDSYLQFPFSLDMGPYLSSSILRSRFGNRIFAFDTDDSDASTELASKFELFAVITHSGRLESGHYVTFLRLSNQWYRCDDAWITQVSESVVRSAQAYMLFYVQKMLFYKANESASVS